MESKIILFDFFRILWSKSPYLKNVEIRIPDTVYIDDEPVDWFFTNKMGKIKKKLRENLTKENILKTFLRKSKGNDIIAKFISTKKYSTWRRGNVRKKTENFFERKYANLGKSKLEGNQTDTSSTIVIEYFNKKNLEKFLNSLPSDHQIVGLLQAIIKPNTSQNSVIRVTWTPHITIFEKRINMKPFADKAFPTKERMITFDGPDFYSQQVNLNSKLINQKITEILRKLQLHFKGILMNKFIPRNMVVYFKQDSRNKIYMLFCTAVKFDCLDEKEKMKNFIEEKINDKFSLPEHSKADFTAIKIKCTDNIRFSICIGCMKNSKFGQLFKLKFSIIMKKFIFEQSKQNRKWKPNQLITHYDHEAKMLMQKKIFLRRVEDSIPKTFKKIYPEMDCQEFLKNIKKKEFLDKEVMLCYECLIPYMKFYGEKGGDLFPNLNSIAPHKGRIYKVEGMKKEKLFSKDEKKFEKKKKIKKRKFSNFKVKKRSASATRSRLKKRRPRTETTKLNSKSYSKIQNKQRPKSSSTIGMNIRYCSFEQNLGYKNSKKRAETGFKNYQKKAKQLFLEKRTNSALENYASLTRYLNANKPRRNLDSMYKIKKKYVSTVDSYVKNRKSSERKKRIEREKEANFFIKRKKKVETELNNN